MFVELFWERVVGPNVEIVGEELCFGTILVELEFTSSDETDSTTGVVATDTGGVEVVLSGLVDVADGGLELAGRGWLLLLVLSGLSIVSRAGLSSEVSSSDIDSLLGLVSNESSFPSCCVSLVSSLCKLSW